MAVGVGAVVAAGVDVAVGEGFTTPTLLFRNNFLLDLMHV